jgi:hypothetical protein
MSTQHPVEIPMFGRLSKGVRPGTLVERTLTFVHDELPKWRDDRDRPREISEELLNAQLCKHLNVAAVRRFQSMVMFQHEEKQAWGRRVDISVQPTKKRAVGSRIHSIYEPFLLLEGKRLPAPVKSREREYLTGGVAPDGVCQKTGGVQRFKLGLHGGSLSTAVLIGYVQAGTLREWHDRINGWVNDLAESLPFGTERWDVSERLAEFTESVGFRVSSSRSVHPRVGVGTHPIALRHLWVRMNARARVR